MASLAPVSTSLTIHSAGHGFTSELTSDWLHWHLSLHPLKFTLLNIILQVNQQLNGFTGTCLHIPHNSLYWTWFYKWINKWLASLAHVSTSLTIHSTGHGFRSEPTNVLASLAPVSTSLTIHSARHGFTSEPTSEWLHWHLSPHPSRFNMLEMVLQVNQQINGFTGTILSKSNFYCIGKMYNSLYWIWF